METSFEIEYTYGSRGRVIVFNIEYNILLGIGYTYSYNLIVTSAIVVFLSIYEALKILYINGPSFIVRLLGTPTEEIGGGKIYIIKKGVYKDIFVCFILYLISPLARDNRFLSIVVGLLGGFFATNDVLITFIGKAAYIAVAP